MQIFIQIYIIYFDIDIDIKTVCVYVYIKIFLKFISFLLFLFSSKYSLQLLNNLWSNKNKNKTLR